VNLSWLSKLIILSTWRKSVKKEGKQGLFSEIFFFFCTKPSLKEEILFHRV